MGTVSTSAPSTEVFTNLFTTHYKSLCYYAYTYVHDTEEAKEIVQGVFLRCWENASFDNPHNVLKSFLFTSVKNASIDSLKHKMVRQQYRSMILLECTDHNDETFESIIHDDLSSKMEGVLNNLPNQCQKIFKLSRFRGLKNKSIALKLNISVKAVEAQISKALSILRQELIDFTN